jgi:type I restriction enzyme M protein
MKELINKVKNLGYEAIQEIDETTFMASHKEVYVYVKKVDDEQLKPDLITSITYDAMGTGPMSTYAWITNGTNNSYILVEKEKAISEIPPVIEGEEKFNFGKRQLTERDIWSIHKYQELQEKFDGIHEMIYGMKDHVNNSNDAIDEFCKLIFMEVFRLNHPDYILRGGDLEGKRFGDIFRYENIEKSEKPEDKNKAVQDIREAFKIVKNHEDYVATLDDGSKAAIFSADEYIKLENPTIYTAVLNTLQDLGPIKVEGVERPGTLLDLTGDVAGRVFDVLLRGKFENKGGMGIYLTPRQVTEAAAEMVLFDLTKDGSGKLVEIDSKTGYPTFKVGDLCCGSAGFLIKMLQEIKNHMLTKLGGRNIKHYEEIFELMKEHSFVGADNSPGMVLKARLNMAMNGAVKCPIFQTRNSLMTENLEPETFDAIITNPPFSKTGVSKTIKKGNTTIDNPEGIEIITKYSEDIDDDGQNKMNPDKLALGSKPDSKGKWKQVNSIDPAVLFIDRNLQLLKKGGLLMIVIPDGILSNSGDKYVREYIMGKKNDVTGEFEGGKAILKAVVSLPSETFSLSGAGAKTSLLYLKKKEHPGEKQGPVFMAVADEVGFTVKQNVEIQLGDDHNDLLKIVEAYKKGMPEHVE